VQILCLLGASDKLRSGQRRRTV